MPLRRIVIAVSARRRAAKLRPDFDADFYLATYPDVAEAGIDPALHYVLSGADEGRDPSPTFSTRQYLDRYPDVLELGVNPYLHFLTTGRRDGRSSTPSKAGDGIAGEVLREHLDTAFYLARNPDVAEAAIDPVHHYLTLGASEGRDPSPEFSTRYYLDANPDVAASGINPFVHYLLTGRAEGRSGKADGGWRTEVLRNLRSLDQTVSDWTKTELPPGPLSSEEIVDQLSAALGEVGRRLLLSIGHDNYLSVSGGIQLCIARETALAREAGIVALNIHPWQPLPRLSHVEDAPDPYVCLVLDDTEIGVAAISELADAIAATVDDRGIAVETVIHSLLGHAPEQVVDLVRSTGTQSCHLWLHDYLTICSGYTLMRNDVAFCGAPSVSSPACHICRHGRERPDHTRRIAHLFEELDARLLSPSQVALDLWMSKSDLSVVSASVVPLVEIEAVSSGTAASRLQEQIDVAFLGAPVGHKGWPVFEELVEHAQGDDAFRFHYFGDHQVGGHIASTQVKVGPGRETAMIDAVAHAEIDLVLHWAEWPETFSFSTFEALAGGAFVVTNHGSGNVAAIVSQSGRGMVLESVDELYAALSDGRLRDLAEKARDADRIEITLGTMSLPFLFNEDRHAERGVA